MSCDVNWYNRLAGGFNLYFYVGFYNIFKEKIHTIIKIICNSNSINWLSTRMYYHRFPKLGELIKVYLVRNLRNVLALKGFVGRECNCNSTTKVNSMCEYRGECRNICIVYKVTWKLCGAVYIDKTHNTIKIII